MAKLFGFDAKGIQAWIAQGNRLVDLALGSELIERLCGEYLDKALDACGINDPNNKIEVKFFSRAGGHFRFEIKDETKANKFQRIWPMVVNSLAPSLPFAFAFVKMGKDAEKKLRKKIAAQQNLPISKLPLAPPIALRAQRTGEGACAFDDKNKNKSDNTTGGAEAIGASAARRRSLRDLIGKGKGELENKYGFENGREIIIDKINKKRSGEKQLNAEDFKSFAFDADAMTDDRETNVLAYIYADGSGLGELFLALAYARDEEEFDGNVIRDAMSDFSRELNIATQRAAEYALWRTDLDIDEKTKTIKARPLVLGGDDLSIILPAKGALNFAKEYLEEFEKEANKVYKKLKGKLEDKHPNIFKDRPKELTCGAGIAYVPSHYPAYKALNLAETMCSWAKEQVKRKASCVAFHRITTSEPEDYKNVYESELKIGDRVLTAGPYLLKECKNCPSTKDFVTIEQIQKLEESASDLPRGAIREILSLAHSPKDAANSRFKRMVHVSHGSRSAKRKNTIIEFEKIIKAMGGSAGSIWLKNKSTPIGDIHAIASVERRITNEESSDKNGGES